MMEECVDDVIPRDVLTCPLCQEDCQQARLMPCLHTFCSKCLDELIYGVNPDKSQIRCPECGYSLGNRNEVTSTILDTIRDNCLVNRLCSSGTRCDATIEDSSVCETSSCGNKSKQKCVNCEEKLCDFCAVIHSNNSETSSHKIIRQEQETVNSNVNSNVTSNDKTVDNAALSDEKTMAISTCCGKYNSFDVSTMFCVDCDVGLCEECSEVKHIGHRCTELTAVAENFEEKIVEPLTELDEMRQTLHEKVASISEEVVSIERSREDAEAMVRKRRELLINMIYEYEATLLSEVQRRYNEKICHLQKRKMLTKKQENGVCAALRLADNILEYGTDEEKVAMRKPIGRRVRELCEQTIYRDVIETMSVDVSEPEVTVEMIGNIFGELTTAAGSDVESVGSHDRKSELSDIDMDLGASGNSDSIRLEKQRFKDCGNVRFHDVVEHIAYPPVKYELDRPVNTFQIPNEIRRDCIKGIGVNENGDVVIGVSQGDLQSVNLIESQGILRGKINVDKGWSIHTVSADGKIAQVMSRGDNRYRVRIIKSSSSEFLVKDAHIESYVPSFITANNRGQVIITACRYPQVCGKLGKAGKAGGNVSIHDVDGYLVNRVVNENFKNLGINVFERPICLATDNEGNFVVADSGNHRITALDTSGDILFQYGDESIEPYSGPDAVCVDNYGNVIVTDKKQKRVDIISRKGCLKRTYYTKDMPKFVAVTRDKRLLVAGSDGIVAFHEYL